MAEMLSFDPKNIRPADIYKFLIGGIAPRPIAWISTVNSLGQGNLAPFSFFSGVCSNPPCLSVSIARKPDGSKKDTLRNIEETKEFVVNSVNRKLAQQMVGTASDYSYGENEMEAMGLRPISALKVKPARVADSLLQFECVLEDKLEIGTGEAGSSTLVVGRIVQIHVSPEVYDNGRIILERYQPVARLGGAWYCEVGNTFEIPIPPRR